METIRFINYTDMYYSLEINLKEISENIFAKYLSLNGQHSDATLTMLPSFKVCNKLNIDHFITIRSFVQNKKGISYPQYEMINLFGTEINKLTKYWLEHDQYRGITMLLFNLDKLIDESNIKMIIE